MNKRIQIWAELRWLAKCPRCGWEDGAGSQYRAQCNLVAHQRNAHGDLKFWIRDAEQHVSEVVDAAGLRAAAQQTLPMAM